jgi:hypothetical protein
MLTVPPQFLFLFLFMLLSSIHFFFGLLFLFSLVQSLLSDPNPASPANAEASQLYERDRGYVRCAVLCCAILVYLTVHADMRPGMPIAPTV